MPRGAELPGKKNDCGESLYLRVNMRSSIRSPAALAEADDHLCAPEHLHAYAHIASAITLAPCLYYNDSHAASSLLQVAELCIQGPCYHPF
jgi:hypothetical protein